MKQLADKKIEDVVILTCKTEDNSAFSQYCTNGKYPYNGSLYRFTTCRKFKGLEADAIILVDVTKKVLCESETLTFYVGASRARFFLSIICQMNDDDCVEVLNHLKPEEGAVKRPKKAVAAGLNAMLAV